MAMRKTTKAVITNAALRVASEDGFEALTIGRLAATLGLSKSGLFSHFGSKEQLQLEVVRKATILFKEKVVDPAEGLSGRDKLERYFQGWLEWADWDELPGGCPFVVGSVEFDDREGPVRESLKDVQERWRKLLVQTVEEGRGKTFRRDTDPEAVVFEVFALYLGHHYYKRVFRTPQAKALTLGAFDALLTRVGAS